MSESLPPSHHKTPLIDLPPVDPPSAKFILQLFVIPFLVVVLLVCALLLVYGLFGKIASGSKDALEHVQIIRSGNENRRWRAAYELASLIHNEPSLASDAKLRADLSQLLIDELKKPVDGMKVETPQYLALSLGAFESLDGLDTLAPNSALAALLQALAETSPAAVRAAAAQSLSRHAAKPGHHLPPAAVVPALAVATKAKDIEVRQHAAYALGYFDTPESRAALAESLGDDSRLVRYNAGSALARLDDPAALQVLREMLSTKDLQSAFENELKDRAEPTNTMIEAVQSEAVFALNDAVTEGRTQLVDQLKSELEMIAQDDSKSLGIKVRELLKKRQHQTTTSNPRSAN